MKRAREDCVFFSDRYGLCYALNEPFCRNEECSFYKSRDDWMMTPEGYVKRKVKVKLNGVEFYC